MKTQTETTWIGQPTIESVNFRAVINTDKNAYNLYMLSPIGSYKFAIVGLRGIKIKSELGGGNYSVFIALDRLNEFNQIINNCMNELSKHIFN
jgi:hypothetical protein